MSEPRNPTPVLTAAQEKRRASIERRLRRVLHDAETLAIEAGCDPDDVELYFNFSGDLYVMNGEPHPSESSGVVSRQDRTVFIVNYGTAVRRTDCGAW